MQACGAAFDSCLSVVTIGGCLHQMWAFRKRIYSRASHYSFGSKWTLTFAGGARHRLRSLVLLFCMQSAGAVTCGPKIFQNKGDLKTVIERRFTGPFHADQRNNNG